MDFPDNSGKSEITLAIIDRHLVIEGRNTFDPTFYQVITEPSSVKPATSTT